MEAVSAKLLSPMLFEAEDPDSHSESFQTARIRLMSCGH